jgi:hypothetical protein
MSILPQLETGGVVYLASSISTYRTRRYGRQLNRVHRHFPRHAVLPARGCFASSEEWRCTWPELSSRIAAAVFFDDGDGFIGRGVWREIHDLRDLGRDVWFLSESGQLIAFDAVSLEHDPKSRSWRRYARVVIPAEAS